MNGNELLTRARQMLSGGVYASTRLNNALGHPLYVTHAEGSRLFSVDGDAYLDMSCSHGAALLGHGHPAVRDALRQAAGCPIPDHDRQFYAELVTDCLHNPPRLAIQRTVWRGYHRGACHALLDELQRNGFSRYGDRCLSPAARPCTRSSTSARPGRVPRRACRRPDPWRDGRGRVGAS